jgi:GT2 family glycosyltransferase
MDYNQITVGIVTFKSENVIFNCLKSIKKIKKIIILDNSNDKILKKKINKKYPKIKILLSKKNLCYGVANNKIIKNQRHHLYSY